MVNVLDHISDLFIVISFKSDCDRRYTGYAFLNCHYTISHALCYQTKIRSSYRIFTVKIVVINMLTNIWFFFTMNHLFFIFGLLIISVWRIFRMPSYKIYWFPVLPIWEYYTPIEKRYHFSIRKLYEQSRFFYQVFPEYPIYLFNVFIDRSKTNFQFIDSFVWDSPLFGYEIPIFSC